nr:hypothetical protein Iba_chr04dCG7510 [Ipomoea batatas]GMC86078.1 hypothetical protein Iba_chr04dCG7520 [Ipomoea batatas]
MFTACFNPDFSIPQSNHRPQSPLYAVPRYHDFHCCSLYDSRLHPNAYTFRPVGRDSGDPFPASAKYPSRPRARDAESVRDPSVRQSIVQSLSFCPRLEANPDRCCSATKLPKLQARQLTRRTSYSLTAEFL